MAKKIVSAGNFSKGIVTDVIGAEDSLLDLKDGWIPRIGEIRKRGSKGLASAYDLNSSSYKTGLSSYELHARGDNDLFARGFAVSHGAGRWYISNEIDLNIQDRQTTISVSLSNAWQNPGGPYSVPVGGGEQMTNYGGMIISTGYEFNEVRIAGKWAGAFTTDLNADVVELTTGRNDVVSGSSFTNDPRAGEFVRIRSLAGFGPVPGPPASAFNYCIVGGGSDEARLDRPWPAVTDTDYEIIERAPIAPIEDPYDTGAPSGKVVEAHQDRLWFANFSPNFSKEGDPEEYANYASRVRWSAVYNEHGTGAINGDLTFYGENLWYPNAFVDVFPGEGGPITQMFSVGNALFIIKEGACYSLRGAVTSKGYNAGASIDRIHNSSGCPSLRGAVRTEFGVAFANERGLWIYDGSQLVNLVDGVIDELWSSTIGAEVGAIDDVVVSSVGDRIIVQTASYCLIYHTDKQYWSRQDPHPGSNIFQFRSVNTIVSEIQASEAADNYIDWSGDFSVGTPTTDVGNAGAPSLLIKTHDIPADTTPFFTARPNNVFMAGLSEDTDLTVALNYGRSGVEADDTEAPLEYGFIEQDHDNAQRLPVRGVKSRPSFNLSISQDTVGARDVRIHGIGVEFLEDYTVDNDD